MINLKKFLLFIFLIAIMLCTSAYANNNASVIEVVNEGITDSSNLDVKIIKAKGQEQSVIYVGKLGGFASGLFSQIDFSSVEAAIFSVYGSSENELIYIIPVESKVSYSLKNIAETKQQPETEAGKIFTNMAIVYDDTYYENVLIPGKILNIPLTVTNYGTVQKELVSYIAKYNLNGCLLELSFGGTIKVPANQTIQTTVSESFSVSEVCTAKVFVWEKDTMTPVSDSIFIKSEIQDYYSDSYTEALAVDFEKNICGVINTSTDVDIVKFTPDTTGIYAVNLTASGETLCGLYNSSAQMINSVSAVEENNYLFYSLTANQQYYLRFTGSENNSYKIIPTQPDEINSVLKNIGIQASLSNVNSYNVYKFTPDSVGEYIITAVGTNNVQAALYNGNYEKIASSQTGDTNVSFRIKSNMAANQEYYIVVYPKTQVQSETYILYVEEPFDLISIQ